MCPSHSLALTTIHPSSGQLCPRELPPGSVHRFRLHHGHTPQWAERRRAESAHAIEEAEAGNRGQPVPRTLHQRASSIVSSVRSSSVASDYSDAFTAVQRRLESPVLQKALWEPHDARIQYSSGQSLGSGVWHRTLGPGSCQTLAGKPCARLAARYARR